MQDHINEEIARLNALEERIMNESGPDDERLQAWHPVARGFMRSHTVVNALLRHCAGVHQQHSEGCG